MSVSVSSTACLSSPGAPGWRCLVWHSVGLWERMAPWRVVGLSPPQWLLCASAGGGQCGLAGGGVSDSQPWSCLWEELCPTALAYSSLTHLKCGKGRQKQRKRKQQGRESGKEGGEEESRVGEQGGTLDGACAGD